MANEAFNRLINSEVRTKAVELPVGKPNVFNKLINLVKYILWYKIVI